MFPAMIPISVAAHRILKWSMIAAMGLCCNILGAAPPSISVSTAADAAETGRFSTLKQFVSNSADINAAQADGTTALHWAVHHGHGESVRFLLKNGANPRAVNYYGVQPLSLACMNGDPEIVRMLLDAGAPPDTTLAGGETVLMTAARTGNPEVVRLLLEAGAEADATERRGQTALMWAAAAGHPEATRILLDHGADFRSPLKSGFTPFFFAVREGHRDIVDLFLERGVDINEPMQAERSGGKLPRRGTTPLILAIENGHFELAAGLLQSGADPNDQLTGYTPLHTMTWVRKPNRGDGDDGTPPPIGSGTLSSTQFIRRLLAAGADPNARLERGNPGRGRLNLKGATPFLMACMTADLEFAGILYENGADPHLPNVENATPLMAAAGIGTLAPGEVAGTEPEAIEVIRFLLDLGAQVNHVDDNGETAMHGAAYKNFPAVVRLLHDHGADPEVWNRKNKYGWSPLLIAEGWRPGNYRPSFDTIEAIHEVMLAHGITPPPRTTEDPNGPRRGYEQR
jgi:ankyrin repeat protein